MHRFQVEKLEQGDVYFKDQSDTTYVESASHIIKNGLIEFFNDHDAYKITDSCLLSDGIVSARLTTGATWVPNKRLTYFPLISFLLMASTLLSCTLINVTLEYWKYPLSASCLLLPFIFIISDMINELYGYRMTRNVIRATAGGLISLGVLAQITIEGLSTHSVPIYSSKEEFNLILGKIYAYMYLSGIVLLISDTFNAWLFREIKYWMRGRKLWFRSLCSNTTAQLGYCTLFTLGYHHFEIFTHDITLRGALPTDLFYQYVAIMIGVTALLPFLYVVVYIVRFFDNKPEASD